MDTEAGVRVYSQVYDLEPNYTCAHVELARIITIVAASITTLIIARIIARLNYIMYSLIYAHPLMHAATSF